jgi:hypothetical protein
MRLLTVIAILFFSTKSHGQFTKTVTLEPIVKQGWRYYYDNRKVLRPYALQIPLQAVKDDEVDLRFKRFQTYQRLQGIAHLAFLLYVLTSESRIDFDTFLILYGATIASDLTLEVLSHHQMSKAIDRYNTLILPQRKVGAHIPGQIHNLSIRLRLPQMRSNVR